VTDPGKYKACNSPFEWLKKRQFPALEIQDQVPFMKLNAIRRGYRVNARGIEAQGIQGGEQLPGRGIRSPQDRDAQENKYEEGGADAHRFSVVTFGIRGQADENLVILAH
jgi:hypothetical protein